MRREPRKTQLLLGAALFAAVVVLYLPSTRNDFLYDDRLLILKQAPLRSVGDVARLFGERYYEGLPYYRPVTAATFALQKTLHGDVPFPFHLFNVLVAGIVAVVVHRLLRSRCFGLRPGTALVATALYLAHPVMSSCVDPVSGRDTLLAIGLVAGAVLAFLRRTPARIAIGLALVVLGLLVKEAAVVAPPLILLAGVLGLTEPRVRNAREFAVRAAPLVAIAAAYAAIRASMFAGELHFGSLALVPLSYLYLLQVGFAPHAALLYEPAPSVWMSAPRLAFTACAVGALALAAIPVWRTIRTRIAFWAGWAFLGLLPAANLVQQETQFDERYIALATLGLVGAAATIVDARLGTERARRIALVGACAAVAALAFLSLGRAKYFDELAFYRQWALVRPGSVTPRYNLGNALTRRNDLDGAIEAYREALAVEPAAARVHYSLALAYAMRSRQDLAAEEFRETIRLEPRNAEAHDGLGTVLAKSGDLAGAAEEYRTAVAIAPENANALRNLGFALVHLGRNEEAIAPLRESLRLEPDSALARQYLQQAEAGR